MLSEGSPAFPYTSPCTRNPPESGISHISLHTTSSVVVCRGNDTGTSGTVLGPVVPVDDEIDLTRAGNRQNSPIRASGEMRSPKNLQPKNCTIDAGAMNATATYKFFELLDVGLSVADNDKGLLVTMAKGDTPFGNAGLAPGT